MSESDTAVQPIDSNLFVTISGPPGCGATTLARRLGEAMQCRVVSGGDLFRELAEERGMSLTQLSAKAQESDEIDRALDQHLETVAEKAGTANEPFVLQSRLAGWLAGDRADLRIYLDAPEEVRKERISNREETAAEMAVREVGEAGRYETYYEIDVDELGFYDLHLNTARWGKRGVFEVVRTAIDEYETDIDEGAFETGSVDLEE